MKKAILIFLSLILIAVTVTLILNARNDGITNILFNSEVKLGNVNLNSKKEFEVTLTNPTKKSFEIEKVYTSCGCTKVIGKPSFSIKRGEVINIRFEFDPSLMHQKGDSINHEIYFLVTNPIEKEYKVTITGKIISVQESVNIYYNQACSDCVTYVQEIQPILNKYKITSELKDYINQPEFRKDLSKENKTYQIPIELQDSLTIFLKQNLIIEGHVPMNLVNSLLENYEKLPKHKLIVLYQPEMHSKVSEITLYISGYRPEKVLIPAYADRKENIVNLIHGRTVRENALVPNKNVLTTIIIGALSNSLHPCAIAVLLLLLTFLYSAKKKKKEIILMGSAYILGIFLVYFLIGLGILKAVSLSSEPFFVAKLASIILIILGLINVKDYFFPNLPIHLKIPDFTKGAIQNFMEKASIPTAFIVGALVGLCAFPCTGGIYTVIISTLAATKSTQFLMYLFIYNFLFVLPLILVVIASSNQKLLEKVEHLEMKNSKKLHLITGVLMILIGLSVYLWIAAIIYG